MNIGFILIAAFYFVAALILSVLAILFAGADGITPDGYASFLALIASGVTCYLLFKHMEDQ